MTLDVPKPSPVLLLSVVALTFAVVSLHKAWSLLPLVEAHKKAAHDVNSVCQQPVPSPKRCVSVRSGYVAAIDRDVTDGRFFAPDHWDVTIDMPQEAGAWVLHQRVSFYKQHADQFPPARMVNVYYIGTIPFGIQATGGTPVFSVTTFSLTTNPDQQNRVAYRRGKMEFIVGMFALLAFVRDPRRLVSRRRTTSAPPSEPATSASPASLVTASCTTGWLDWIHGDLWILPNGLLRIRSDLGTTVAHGTSSTVSDHPIKRVFTTEEIDRLLHEHNTNLWVPADTIVSADIHTGLLTGRLALTLRDGRHLKLLWLRADNASEPIQRALASWAITA